MSLTVDERLACLVPGCTFKSHSLVGHLLTAHGITAEEYTTVYPGAILVSEKAREANENRSKAVRRSPAPKPEELTVKLMTFDCPVDSAVSPEYCLPWPKGYMFPTKGKAKAVYERTLMGLTRGRNLFIWGMPGTGKDAIVHAYSHKVRKPVVMVTFRPGTDLAPWFYTRSISENGTGWEYGHLWKVLTEGVMARDGKPRAALILLSDVDRADAAQAEWFRILTDSIEGRILDPNGKTVPIFPGTQFVCTANSCGSGDARGRMASANPMDASIMDRLGRKIEAAYLHWDDESVVLRGKFPRVAQMSSDSFVQLGNATEALRKAIENEDIYAEFTHRGLCEILSECDDILDCLKPNEKVPTNLLKRGFRAWLDGVDSDTQLNAKRLIDPHLKGGSFGSANSEEE